MNKLLLSISLFMVSLPAISQDQSTSVSFEAQSMEILEAENVTILEGSVKLERGNLNLEADYVRVYSEKKGEDEVEFVRLEAHGNLVVISGSQTITASEMTYEAASEMALFSGNVVIKSGGNEARGERAEVNMKTGVHTLHGPVRGTITGKLP